MWVACVEQAAVRAKWPTATTRLRIPNSTVTEYDSGAMTQQSVTFVMRRKRGNPNWGKPFHHNPVLATQFEVRVSQLRLTPEDYFFSAVLREWCERNRNRCYIPESLLKSWGITVDANFSNA